MDDLKERLHQIACCQGECRENRIEAWERIAKLEQEVKDAFYDGRDARVRAEKAEAQLDIEIRERNKYLKQAIKAEAKNIELQEQLDAVRNYTNTSCDTVSRSFLVGCNYMEQSAGARVANGIFKAINSALNGEDK